MGTTVTTNYGLIKPNPFEEEDAWGPYLNSNWDTVDTQIKARADAITALQSSKQDADADLTAIAGLAGTSGFLTKTGSNTWALDTTAYQPLDADLTAIGALAGTSGFLTKTGANTWVLDTASYQPLDADLTAIAALSGSTGFLRKTAPDTWTIDTASYQPLDADLTALAGLSHGADNFIVSNGSTWTTEGPAQARTSLGLGALAVLSSVSASELDTGSVTTAKIADNSVTGAKIALGSDAQGDIMFYNGTDWDRLPAGSAGQVLQSGGAGANPAWGSASAPDVIIEDQKAANTDGGSFNSGADRTRTLNTEVRDALNICTLASNQFTLPAGTYYMEWNCPAYAVDGHQSLLYNVTTATTVKRGSTAYGSSGTSVQTESRGNAVVTIAGSTAFEIRHRCVTTRATTGFGIAANLGTEVYACVNIWKVG
ncbi:MAG: hypothetical protein RI988_2942 [Pseudomonadota bacterium]|jgi:hypothetical protein